MSWEAKRAQEERDDVGVVETGEAQRSGEKKSPRKCLMSRWLCYTNVTARTDASRSDVVAE